jgi:TolB-like protein
LSFLNELKRRNVLRVSAASTAASQSPHIPARSWTACAVLPFVNMNDDKSNEHFSDGISEELLDLSQYQGNPHASIHRS